MTEKTSDYSMDELCGNAAPVKAKMQPKLDRYQAIMLLFAEAFGPLVHAVADIEDATRKVAAQVDSQRKEIIELKKQLKDREVLS